MEDGQRSDSLTWMNGLKPSVRRYPNRSVDVHQRLIFYKSPNANLPAKPMSTAPNSLSMR